MFSQPVMSPSEILGASLVLSVVYCSVGAAQDRLDRGVRVRVEVLKQAPIGAKVGPGPELLGGQGALDFEWHVGNKTGETVEIPSPATVLRVSVSSGGRELPIRTEWATEMKVHSYDRVDILPVGPLSLSSGTSLSIRGSTERADQSAFGPGEYVVRLEAVGLRQVSAAGTATIPPVDTGLPIRLQILGLTSTAQWRHFHIIEAGFYKAVNPERALEHYAALATMPGAPWSDSLPLARMYSDLARFRDAAAVFRRILPDLVRSVDSPFGTIIRDARHLHVAAMNLAADGDSSTAANLLRVEGRTPEKQIPEEIARLRKSALVKAASVRR